MKRAVSATLTVLLLIIFTQPSFALEPHRAPNMRIHSEIVYLFNLDEQNLIYQRNADQPTYPASLVKIMTCILALENTPDLRVMVTFPTYIQNYLFNYQVSHGVTISLAGLRAGDELSMHDLLHGLMLQSGNEIAMIIADHIGGSQPGRQPGSWDNQDEFVDMMNRRARELGATNTNFTNANGLPDPQMVTTARDMAMITKHAMGLPGFMDIVTATSYVARPANRNARPEWTTTITMQVPGNRHFYPHLRGIKTGSTPQAGRNFISSASRDGFTYLLVVMDAPFINPETAAVFPENYAFVDTRNIYDWVFDNFRTMTLVGRNMRVHEIPLRLNASQDFLPLETADRLAALVARDIDPAASLTRIYEVPDWVNAPVQRGEHIGYLRLFLYDQELGRVALLAAETIEASRLLLLLDQVRAITRLFGVRVAIIFIILAVILYVALMIVRNKNRRHRSSYKRRRRI